MSDSAHRSCSTETAEGWPQHGYSDASSPPLRSDSRNTLFYPTSLLGSTKMTMTRPSLQSNGGRQASLTSLSGPRTVIPPTATPASMTGPRLQSISQHSLSLYHYRPPESISYTRSLTISSATSRMPIASPDNDYLGFCKGAWKFQNGDKKGAMEKCKQAQSWSRNASRTTTLAQHLQCSQSKCSFRSNYIIDDGDLIYDKIATYYEKGIRLRWTFLAKSHVPQKVVIRNQYAFKCLFCVFSGLGAHAGVYVGTEYYLDHINTNHRGQAMSEVLLSKTNCVNDKIAENDVDFDVNLWPLDVERTDPAEQWLSVSLLGDKAHMPRLPPHDTLGANEPWIVDSSVFGHFDTAAGVHGEDDRATAITPIRLGAAHDRKPRRRSSEQSEAYSPATVVPANFPSPPEHDPVGDLIRADQEHNPEETWRASHRTPEEERSGEAPNVPPHSNARSSSIRESKDAPEILQYAHQFPHLLKMQALQSPMNTMHMSITNSLNTILKAYNSAQAIVDEIKQRQSIVAKAQLITMLEESVLEAPEEIDREWQRGILRFGESSEMGDYIALIALQRTAITLHNKLVDALRVVAHGKPSDFCQLGDVADSSRRHVISTLHDLRRTLMQAPRSIMSGSHGFLMERTMSPEPYDGQQPQRSTSHPTQSTQHISHMRPDWWKDPYFPDKSAGDAAHSLSASTQGSRHNRAQ